MRILAIETSCDDTGIAILEERKGRLKLLADLVSSQVKIHAKWGGVVPMLAKREHQRNLLPLLKQILKKAGLITFVRYSECSEESRGIRQLAETRTADPSATPQDDKRKLKTLKIILEREPELLKKLLPFLKKYRKPDVDLIAVTIGPGLEPALWVGINFARALASFWNLPILPVNHIEGHIAANWRKPIGGITNYQLPIFNKNPNQKFPRPRSAKRDGQNSKKIKQDSFPAIALVVSGGHTQLVLVKEKKADVALSEGRRPASWRGKVGVSARHQPALQALAGPLRQASALAGEAGGGTRERETATAFDYQILGETRDDAAGEAFDKVAKMLNLGYPGGPAIAKLANIHKSKHKFSRIKIREIGGKLVKISDIRLPRPMINSGNLDFSFSGLKTAVFYLLKKMDKKQRIKLTPAIAAEFQQAVIDVLIAKTLAAAQKYQAKTIILAGGVAANDELRKNFKLKTSNLKLNFLAPEKKYCTDNGAMIALAAFLKTKNSKKQKTVSWLNLKAQANLRIDDQV